MKKLSGFTLAEMIIAIGIIGILMASALLTLKPFDKNIKALYANTYDVLDKALYNSMKEWVMKDQNLRDPFIDSYIQNGSKVQVSHGSSYDEGTRRLCVALSQYLNTNENGSSCSATHLVGDAVDDSKFTKENVQFTAVNGIRYWISNRYPTKANKEVYFYLIYADLNGEKLPNSVKYEVTTNGIKEPDIFAFAALSTGRICPLGIAEVNKEYLTTRIKYKDMDSEEGGVYKFSTPSKEYAFSKAEAWGYYLIGDKIPQGAVANDAEIMEDVPYSYNGYIKQNISSESGIYSFLEGKTLSEYLKDKDLRLKSNDIQNGGYNCAWRSEEDCRVIIDKYMY